MPVKFKIGFTMDAETLFGIIAKFLPLEQLSVEEVIERPRHEPQPRLPKSVQIAKPERHSKPIKVDAGVNGLILQALADGQQHRFSDIQASLGKAGYAHSGLGSKLKRLLEHGAIVRVEQGVYRKGEP